LPKEYIYMPCIKMCCWQVTSIICGFQLCIVIYVDFHQLWLNWLLHKYTLFDFVSVYCLCSFLYLNGSTVSNLSHVKIFLSLVFISTAPKINLK
jgi:hypothetical protein